ncbi:hypothetical protein OF83DRAFT_464327 [Amylostereum chailletii]|nr:hypothetical protein OF83DRAFT_464327 [Amylostereum chailletii]
MISLNGIVWLLRGPFVAARRICVWTFGGSPPAVREGQGRTEGKTETDLSSHASVHALSESRPRLHALIIGIDQYECFEIPPLRGAVADRITVKTYVEDFKNECTAGSVIHTLFDNEATYDSIVTSLNRFCTEEQINRDDPIVVYFAGYGSTMPSVGEKILLAYDSHRSQKGDFVHVMTDRLLGALLADIAEAKGDNITVILDCCHSVPSTCGNGPIRGILFKGGQDLPGVASSAPVTPKMSKHKSFRSHVRLSACATTEFAREKGGRGVFTLALLNALQSLRNSNEKVSYSELIDTRIQKLEWQTPRCDGQHSDRLLFEPSSAAHQRNAEPVETNPPAVRKSHSASHQENISLRVYVPDHTWLRDALQKEIDAAAPGKPSGAFSWDLSFVDKATAQMTVASDGDSVVFKHLENGIPSTGPSSLGLDHISHRLTEARASDVIDILYRAAHFFSYVCRSSETDVLSGLCVYMVTLHSTNRLDKHFSRILEPDPNAIDCMRCNTLDIEADNKTLYGIHITNTSSKTLYVSVFVFNASNLEIELWYQSCARGNSAPLRPHEELTIGYGTGGTAPYKWYLPPGQDHDISFIKLFFSGEPMDLSDIQQASPFSGTRARMAMPQRARGVWDTVTIGVKQSAPGSAARV